jgi:hypothetical protein
MVDNGHSLKILLLAIAVKSQTFGYLADPATPVWMEELSLLSYFPIYLSVWHRMTEYYGRR